MSILLIWLCFIATFFSIGLLSSSSVSLKEILLRGVLIFSGILVAITELLSAFHAINFRWILIAWLVVFMVNIVYLFFKRKELTVFMMKIKKNACNAFYGFTRLEKFLFFSVLTLLTLVVIQGIVYPPNSGDSMTYHLPRIINWISRQSLEFYPAYTFRQLYQLPFAEFVILHFNVLNWGDYFSSLVEFFFLIFSLFSLILIMEWLRLGHALKVIAIVLAVTMPETLLQASSTQNDIVISFFIITTVYFCIRTFKEWSFQNYLLLGLSIWLSVFTKGTAYIYLAPILFAFSLAMGIKLYKTRDITCIRYSLIAALIFICINSGHYVRSYVLTDNILGIDKREHGIYKNAQMNPLLLLSNIIKNAWTQIGPYPLNRLSEKAVYKLHTWLGIGINTSGTNFLNKKYVGSEDIPNFEDKAPNTIHFLLILLSFLLVIIHMIRHKRDPKIILYCTILCCQALIFCGYLRWQPFHTRLETPLFLLSVPLVCYALSLHIKYIKIFYVLLFFILLFGLFVVLCNQWRPFISTRLTKTNQISLTDSRYKKYFSLIWPTLYPGYEDVTEKMRAYRCKDVGLLLQGEGDMEYGLFSKFYASGINPIYLNVQNITKTILQEPKNMDCVVSRVHNASFLIFHEKIFYNQNQHSRGIWLYK